MAPSLIRCCFFFLTRRTKSYKATTSSTQPRERWVWWQLNMPLEESCGALMFLPLQSSVSHCELLVLSSVCNIRRHSLVEELVLLSNAAHGFILYMIHLPLVLFQQWWGKNMVLFKDALLVILKTLCVLVRQGKKRILNWMMQSDHFHACSFFFFLHAVGS